MESCEVCGLDYPDNQPHKNKDECIKALNQTIGFLTSEINRKNAEICNFVNRINER